MLHTLFLLALVALVHGQDGFMGPKAIHFNIHRRGGAFAPNRTADMDWLLEQLHIAEGRFNLTQREVRSNKVVRAPKSKAVGGGTGDNLIGDIGRWGAWFTRLRLGASRQPIETDIDMLTADFAIRSANSKIGSKFDEFFSSTYNVDYLKHPFTNCLYPTDQVLIPSTQQPFMLDFAHCRPPHQSRDVLLPSGGIWGLAPAPSLRQMDGTVSFVQQLLDSSLVDNEVFSITLLNGREGILTVGGTVAESVAMIEDRIERFLGKPADQPTAMAVQDFQQDLVDMASGAPDDLMTFGHEHAAEILGKIADRDGLAPVPVDVPPAGDGNAPVLRKAKRDAAPEPIPEPVVGPQPKSALQRRDLSERVDPVLRRAGSRPSRAEHNAFPSWRDAWKWSPVEGAAGWWQTLMRGVWVDQAKVLKNQPVVIDLSTPFILAPPLAAKAFYASISGTRRLKAPYQNFYAFPCNNPPFIHVEFQGWRFPVMRGSKSMTGGGPDGKFSLGKVEESSGYCVGAVVETRIGVGDQGPVKRHSRKDDSLRGLGAMESGMLAGNGMRDVWVLGEPAFRGLGIVFDAKNKEIGFRTY